MRCVDGGANGDKAWAVGLGEIEDGNVVVGENRISYVM